VIEPVLQRRAHQGIDDRSDFRIVEAILRLTLELRLFEKHAEDAVHPFADVLGRERDPFR
jgi:hypothetical protein